MKKIFIIAWILALTILASCGTSNDASTQVKADVVVQETSAPAEQQVIEENIDEPIVLAQWFIEYDESYLGESDSTVLFFHSAGCGSCRATEDSLKETWVTDGTTVLKIDFDDSANFELRKKYGVTKYHTFVQVDAQWNEIKKWGGSLSNDDIQEQLGSWEEVMEKETELMEKTEEVVEVSNSTQASAWIYANYDASLVGNTENTVLFFHASWCPSCRAADTWISAGEIPLGLTVLKADFDSELDLRKQYGVVAQHTFILLDANWNEVKKWVWGTSIEDITEKL